MLSFVSGWAKHVGLHDWDDVRPVLDTEFIFMAMCEQPNVLSWKSVEVARGFYSTWTEGPQVSGSQMGLNSSKLTTDARIAFLQAQSQYRMEAVFVNPTVEYTGQIRPGVIDADKLAGCWWISLDELAKAPMEQGGLFDLTRPKTKAAIRYKGVVYPLDDMPESKITLKVP